MTVPNQFKKTVFSSLDESFDEVFNDREEDIWLENPVTFREFITSKEHMDFPPLSERQLAVPDFLFGDDGKKIFDNMNTLAVLCYGKGCPAAGMKIFQNNSAKRIPVEEWKGGQLLSLVADKIEVKDATPSSKTGTGKIFRVTTASGFSIDVYEGHKFLQGIRVKKYNPASKDKDYLLRTQWAELRNLKVGDHISVLRNWKVRNSKKVDLREARLLGYWLGDGYLCAKNGAAPSLTVGFDSPTIRKDYLEIAESYDLSTRIYPHFYGARCENIYVARRKNKRSLKYKNTFKEIAKKYGVFGLNSYTKKIPDEVFSWNQQAICAFLRALFATDGYVSIRTMYNKQWKKHSVVIGYDSMSEELCKGLKLLLLRIGVHSSFNRKPKSKCFYTVIRRNIDVRTFCKKVNIIDKELKQEQALQHIAGRDSRCFGSGTKNAPDVTWDSITAIEYLGIQDYFDLAVPSTQNYICEGFVSHNSGKDMISSLMMCYVVYVLLCMKSPQQFFQLPTGEPLDLVNIAKNAEQASSVYFEKLKQRVLHWVWLKSKYTIKMSGIYLGQIKEGEFVESSVVITKNGILFPNAIRAFSGHSETQSQEGHNILFFVGDEVSTFDDSPLTTRAEQIFNMLRTSAVSRFGQRWKGALLSFPRYADDFILRMHAKYETDLHAFVDRAATWEVKPAKLFAQYPEKYFMFEQWKIPLEFEKEFLSDPDDARGKYCTYPVAITQAFIESPEKILLAVDKDRLPLVDTEDYVEDGMARKRIITIRSDSVQREYVAFLDLGLKNDSAAISIFHKKVDSSGEFLIQSYVGVWEPDKGKHVIVDLMDVKSFLITLKERINLTHCFFDQWNSALLVQELNEAGLGSEIYFLNFQSFKNYKELLYSGKLRLLNYAPQLQEIRQLVMTKAQKVHHSAGGSSDISDTICGACKMLSVTAGGSGGSGLGGEFITENVQTMGGHYLA